MFPWILSTQIEDIIIIEIDESLGLQHLLANFVWKVINTSSIRIEFHMNATKFNWQLSVSVIRSLKFTYCWILRTQTEDITGQCNVFVIRFKIDVSTTSAHSNGVYTHRINQTKHLWTKSPPKTNQHQSHKDRTSCDRYQNWVTI